MLKDLFFQKGWAGKTISRSETVERLNPLVEAHMRLNRSYDSVASIVLDSDVSTSLNEHQRTARVNVSKLLETIFSCGGVAYSGTELEPTDFDLGSDVVAALGSLQEMEEKLKANLEAESEVEHQMRTRAIIGVLSTSTDQRLKFLRDSIQQLR